MISVTGNGPPSERKRCRLHRVTVDVNSPNTVKGCRSRSRSHGYADSSTCSGPFEFFKPPHCTRARWTLSGAVRQS